MTGIVVTSAFANIAAIVICVLSCQPCGVEPNSMKQDMDEEDLEPHMQELRLGGSYVIWHAQRANEERSRRSLIILKKNKPCREIGGCGWLRS